MYKISKESYKLVALTTPVVLALNFKTIICRK